MTNQNKSKNNKSQSIQPRPPSTFFCKIPDAYESTGGNDIIRPTVQNPQKVSAELRAKGHFMKSRIDARIDVRLLGLVAAFVIQPSTLSAAEPLKAMIIDGQNNHDWKKTTPILKQTLESSGR